MSNSDCAVTGYPAFHRTTQIVISSAAENMFFLCLMIKQISHPVKQGSK